MPANMHGQRSVPQASSSKLQAWKLDARFFCTHVRMRMHMHDMAVKQNKEHDSRAALGLALRLALARGT